MTVYLGIVEELGTGCAVRQRFRCLGQWSWIWEAILSEAKRVSCVLGDRGLYWSCEADSRCVSLCNTSLDHETDL